MSAAAEDIRCALRGVADLDRAVGDQSYMKSTMPFLGARVPVTRRIARRRVASVTDADEVLSLSRELWDAATYREERYAALHVLAAPALRGDRRVLDAAEDAVRSMGWWDITDEVASRVADLLDDSQDAPEVAERIRSWATDEDAWIRRLAIIAQLGRKLRTDRDLLRDVIAPNATDSFFFLRKGIGWALRDYGDHDPEWVVATVDALPLTPLSRREALRKIRARS